MITRLPIAVAALLAVSALALSPGCQVFENSITTANAPASPTAQIAIPAVPPAATGDTGGSIAVAPVAAVERVNDDPMQFMGLNGDLLDGQLGHPDLVRRDGPAEVRQFQGGACTLDLFLYPQNGTMAVKHVELRGASLDNLARRTCLAEMIRARTIAG
ncbi:MAG: hypothetical protein CMM78_11330 [Rhodospirillaceae bacterium]|jgi:hypothetical protein|uniref:hypothetical protein n=1 Tax=unclassified Hwanghaeella TaxID=2605944 RepID=UPI000C4F0E67|nr:hypothetical protein [Rhodospirillales bacterium]MAX48792.1 hypothetical protein [Rhodospirillaceae bacterium]|tara:strand:+ start:1166 stop:1642 length:477 start_codon:yes stop_codon:yes gene_type:complete